MCAARGDGLTFPPMSQSASESLPVPRGSARPLIRAQPGARECITRSSGSQKSDHSVCGLADRSVHHPIARSATGAPPGEGSGGGRGKEAVEGGMCDSLIIGGGRRTGGRVCACALVVGGARRPIGGVRATPETRSTECRRERLEHRGRRGGGRGGRGPGRRGGGPGGVGGGAGTATMGPDAGGPGARGRSSR